MMRIPLRLRQKKKKMGQTEIDAACVLSPQRL